MYVDSSTVTVKGKTYTRHLLRQSFRDQGKVKHRTLANLSRCSTEEIQAIKLALKHKHDLHHLGSLSDDLTLQQGPAIGAVWTVFAVARQLGIVAALGSTRQGQLATWQVIARIIGQGSRLSAVRLATTHAACDILGLGKFNEEDLYENLDWLCRNQVELEDRPFRRLYPAEEPQLFLYDVTSSDLEGTENELAAFGYNRDGKKGKRQIVLGLLCDQHGRPLSVEVFRGNTPDPATFASQVQKAAQRFGSGPVTFVGDRGMIKGQQTEDLVKAGFHYITAITKPQIEGLLTAGLIRMELFDRPLAEVEAEGVRYVLRRNPTRAAEVAASRHQRLQVLRARVIQRNGYLAEHPRARVGVALRAVQQQIRRLKLSGWISASATGRELSLAEDGEALTAMAKLDGCYVLKTDLAAPVAPKEVVHDRYKDLALVEWAFRCSKTVHLEARPVYVRLESRARGHALVVMLAYRIIAELARRWQALDLTVPEGLDQLCGLCATEVVIGGVTRLQKIPRPRESVQRLLEAADVELPEVLPSQGVKISTNTQTR
jgi:Transposase DDE domain